MRAAQYKLPRVESDREDASLVLYYFGQGQGGSISDNVDRWIGQMEQPGGGSSKEKAKTETITVNGLKVTMVDVGGKPVSVQIGLNLTIVGSKELPQEGGTSAGPSGGSTEEVA